jgi:exodeoxyribonuclease VII large subunit
LSPRLLSHRIERCREQTAAFSDRGRRAFRIFRDRRVQRLRSAGQLLAAYSYRGVLARGFALVRDGDGRPLRTAAAVGSGMRLDIEFSDGRVGATADGEGAAAQSPAKPKPRRRGGGSGGQGSLFGA